MAQFFVSGSKKIEAEFTNTNPEELMVIGAGLPRTGTLSMKAALVKLFKGKCYHMTEVWQGDQEDLDIWMSGLRGQNSPEDWRQYFRRKGFVTGVDFPMSLCWKELSDVYPNAKIVLSTRDPETWYDSVYNSVWQFNVMLHSSWTFRLMCKMFDMRRGSENWMDTVESTLGTGMSIGVGPAISAGREVCTQFFKDWENSVKANIPPERLLVHRAKDGWEPLCKFLGVPVPDEPYPHINDTASIKRDMRNLKLMHMTMFYILPVSMAFLGGYFLKDKLHINN